MALRNQIATMTEMEMPLTLIGTLPSLATELVLLLTRDDELGLAAQVPGLTIVDRCRCGDDFCSTFYTKPKPVGAYGPSLRTVALTPSKGWLILDVVDEQIMCVEVLYRDEIRTALLEAVP